MKLSHSKLATILNCPMTYYLTYKVGISLKIEKPALSLGSAVHWGIEHNTYDLSKYYNQEGSFKQQNNYTDEQLLAESMIKAYLKNKDKLFSELLFDSDLNKNINLLEETHEIYLTGQLKSFIHEIPHEFVGIIDLLLLTEKGFIVVDYKTSSKIPNWDDYLDQIYRYIFLLKSCFPNVPIYKIAIINLRKTNIRRKQKENDISFRKRIELEYSLNDENYISCHIFEPDKLNKDIINDYINNLSKMADTAEMIDINNMWFINYNAANNLYGKSQFWDIFYKTPDCFILYNIKDTIYDKSTNSLLTKRPCKDIDMKIIENKNILNKYEKFKSLAISFYSCHEDINKEDLFKYLKNNFLTDDELLNEYWDTLTYEINEESKNGKLY